MPWAGRGSYLVESGCICKSFLPSVALLGSVFSCYWDKLTSQNIDTFQVQVSNISRKQCFTLHLHELLFWLSRNLHKQSSVINFTLLFNAGNLCIVPVQHKPGNDDVGAVVQDIQSAGKSIVSCWDEPNVEHWSFAKLGYTLGNLPSLVANMTSKALSVGSVWVLVSLWECHSLKVLFYSCSGWVCKGLFLCGLQRYGTHPWWNIKPLVFPILHWEVEPGSPHQIPGLCGDMCCIKRCAQRSYSSLSLGLVGKPGSPNNHCGSKSANICVCPCIAVSVSAFMASQASISEQRCCY